MLFDTLAIVGVGLLGGSVGRAAKARGIARRVIGVGRSAEFLALAVELGTIDEYTTELAEAFAAADLVVIATPVDAISAVIRAGAPNAKPGAIITDVGSTKDSICSSAPAGIQFVGSHPLAGSEKVGVEHARADLFEGRMVVVVPRNAREEAVETVETFWRRLGARTTRMTAAEHDRAVAMTSHAPHAIASALAKTLPPEWLPLVASGFKDTTRVAAGDPALWKAIFFDNKDHVLAALGRFRRSLDGFESALGGDDAAGLLRWLDEGKQVRDALGD